MHASSVVAVWLRQGTGLGVSLCRKSHPAPSGLRRRKAVALSSACTFAARFAVLGHLSHFVKLPSGGQSYIGPLRC
jgi:hypothetical protein